MLFGVCPTTTPLIDVDLNSRTILIENQPAYKEFLSVEKDHLAETIFFKVPRYFDDMDLNRTTAVIEYVNAAGESHVSPILFKDLTSYPGYMVLGWIIQGAATKVAGPLQFGLRFYRLAEDEDDPSNYHYIYNLRTQAVHTKILYGLDALQPTPEEETIYEDGQYLIMLQNYNELTRQFKELMESRYWNDVTEIS